MPPTLPMDGWAAKMQHARAPATLCLKQAGCLRRAQSCSAPHTSSLKTVPTLSTHLKHQRRELLRQALEHQVDLPQRAHQHAKCYEHHVGCAGQRELQGLAGRQQGREQRALKREPLPRWLIPPRLPGWLCGPCAPLGVGVEGPSPSPMLLAARQPLAAQAAGTARCSAPAAAAAAATAWLHIPGLQRPCPSHALLPASWTVHMPPMSAPHTTPSWLALTGAACTFPLTPHLPSIQPPTCSTFSATPHA